MRLDDNNLVVKDLYDSMADTYDFIDTEAFYKTQYSIYQFYLDKYKKQLSGKVLDIGCGTGIQTEWLATNANIVYGIDISPLLLEKAKQKCKNFNNVIIEEIDAIQLPYEDNKFDTVISFGESISHIKQFDLAFSESTRVLQKDGLFLFTVLNKWNFGVFQSFKEIVKAFKTKNGHWRTWYCIDDNKKETAFDLKTFTKKEIIKIGKIYGFEIINTEGIHVTSMIFPLKWHEEKFNFIGKLAFLLGKLDKKITKNNCLSNFGYTCLYVAKRK